MKCQHGLCLKDVAKVPIICIRTKNPTTSIHVIFPALMGCDQHTQEIVIEDLLDAGAWPLIRRECNKQHMFPDIKTLSFHLLSIAQVIQKLQADTK